LPSKRSIVCVSSVRHSSVASHNHKAKRRIPSPTRIHATRPCAEASTAGDSPRICSDKAAVSPRSSWSSGQCEVEQLHPRPPAAVTTPAPLPDRRVFPPPIPPQITPLPWTLPRISAANIGPNRFHQNRTVSWLMSIPRSATDPRRCEATAGIARTSSQQDG
jgi:hypothetical protein